MILLQVVPTSSLGQSARPHCRRASNQRRPPRHLRSPGQGCRTRVGRPNFRRDTRGSHFNVLGCVWVLDCQNFFYVLTGVFWIPGAGGRPINLKNLLNSSIIIIKIKKSHHFLIIIKFGPSYHHHGGGLGWYGGLSY